MDEHVSVHLCLLHHIITMVLFILKSYYFSFKLNQYLHIWRCPTAYGKLSLWRIFRQNILNLKSGISKNVPVSEVCCRVYFPYRLMHSVNIILNYVRWWNRIIVSGGLTVSAWDLFFERGREGLKETLYSI